MQATMYTCFKTSLLHFTRDYTLAWFDKCWSEKTKWTKRTRRNMVFTVFHGQIKNFRLILVHSDFHRKKCPLKYLKMFYTDFIHRQQKILLAVKTEFSGLSRGCSATKYYCFTEKILDIIQFFKLEGQCVYCLTWYETSKQIYL